MLEGELPSLVQMDVSLLAGILAERLVATFPGGLDKVFFANSGASGRGDQVRPLRDGRPGLVTASTPSTGSPWARYH